MIEYALPAVSLGAAAVTAAFNRRRMREIARQRDVARSQVRQWQMSAMEMAREGDRHRVEMEALREAPKREPLNIVSVPPLTVLPNDDIDTAEALPLPDLQIRKAQEALQARMQRRTAVCPTVRARSHGFQENAKAA